MTRWARRGLQGAAVAIGGAIVAVWFRNRDDIIDEPAPGSAQWPPLQPLATVTPYPTITEPTDGAPADPAPAASWVDANSEGDCPLSHPVKAKDGSGIYHVDGGMAYERTNADRCYPSAEAAEADGYRASKI